MKKTLLTIFSLILFGSFAFGQTFSDDFESYNVGDYLGSSSPNWTTWSGNTGTTEDVRITDENAASGSNAIKFASTSANGGPQDVVLFFGGQKLSAGSLNTKMNMLVETGAYFNFQREVTIGQTWAMNAFFEEDGNGRITGSGNQTILSFQYPYGEWFEFEMLVNFDANKWQLKVNGECVGSFSNDDNAIASIDLFPLSGNSFFIDDFEYTYDAETPEIKDDVSTRLNVTYQNGLAGTEVNLGGSLTNEGSTVVNSIDVEVLVDGNAIPYTEEGLNLAKGETHDFVVNNAFMIPEGFTNLTMVVNSINGGTFIDEDVCNDKADLLMFGTVPAEHKRVIVEEATGTWCGWCPRGTVWMDRMTNKYPDHFIGIAVHDNDPMADADYDNGLGASAFPNAVVNRGPWIDPASIEPPFLTDVKETSAAVMENGALWNPDTRELTMSLVVTSLEDITPGHRINVALTEDGVRGTGNGWGQANYYSGGADLIDDNGINWADLPSTVPGSQMVYDHVARAILAPFDGMPESFEAMMPTDDSKVFNFTYTVPEGFDEGNMHIVTMLINPDGTINTGESTTIQEAVDNGFVMVTSTHSVQLDNATSVYPNPMTEYTTVDINLVEQTDVTITVVDMAGKTMLQNTYNNKNGFFRTHLDVSSIPVGNYIVKINTNEYYTAKKITVVR